MQFGGCHRGRPLPGRRAVPGRGLPVPGRERHLRGDRRDDVAALRDPEDRQREDRVHRPDARGHAERSSRPPVSPAWSSTRRSQTIERARRRSSATSRASGRSSCCSTRAASRTRRRPVVPRAADQPDAYVDVNRCVSFGGPRSRRSPQGSIPQVDVIVSAHTHAPYICPNFAGTGKLLTSASSFGRVITDIDLVIDHQSKDVKSATAKNVIVTQDVAKDPGTDRDRRSVHGLRRLRSRTRSSARSRPTSRGRVTDGDATGESALGDVIADAQLEATRRRDFGGAVIAFMNPGGIRADLALRQTRPAASCRARSRTASSSPCSRSGTRSSSRRARATQIKSAARAADLPDARRPDPPGVERLHLLVERLRGRSGARSTGVDQAERRHARPEHGLPRDDEQLPRERRGRVHRLQRSARTRSAARSTSTRSSATSWQHSPAPCRRSEEPDHARSAERAHQLRLRCDRRTDLAGDSLRRIPRYTPRFR